MLFTKQRCFLPSVLFTCLILLPVPGGPASNHLTWVVFVLMQFILHLGPERVQRHCTFPPLIADATEVLKSSIWKTGNKSTGGWVILKCDCAHSRFSYASRQSGLTLWTERKWEQRGPFQFEQSNFTLQFRGDFDIQNRFTFSRLWVTDDSVRNETPTSWNWCKKKDQSCVRVMEFSKDRHTDHCNLQRQK